MYNIIIILLICIFMYTIFKYLYADADADVVESFKPINVLYRPFLRNVNNVYTQAFIQPQIYLSNYFRKLQII